MKVKEYNMNTQCLILEDVITNVHATRIFAENVSQVEEKLPHTDRLKSFLDGDSYSSALFVRLLFNDEFRKMLEPFTDFSFRTVAMNVTSDLELGISEYKKDGFYDWHVDNVSYKRILNVILFLNTPVGGELQLSKQMYHEDTKKDLVPEFTYKPQKYEMIVFPSHYPHRVLPVKEGNRIILHGHYVL